MAAAGLEIGRVARPHGIRGEVAVEIRSDNPELAAARARRLPVVRRADMLAELMRLKRSIAVAGTESIASAAEAAAKRNERPGVACARRIATRMLAALGEGTWMHSVVQEWAMLLTRVTAPLLAGAALMPIVLFVPG